MSEKSITDLVTIAKETKVLSVCSSISSCFCKPKYQKRKKIKKIRNPIEGFDQLSDLLVKAMFKDEIAPFGNATNVIKAFCKRVSNYGELIHNFIRCYDKDDSYNILENYEALKISLNKLLLFVETQI
ncbi:hypothetical protein ACTFIT_008991 [Dictyostelium discoideum]